ncbi:MAG: hypothetical protein FJX46_11380 [Alphaproteobacteria bacterium]|nr:hypothetical protein [Alphaproteobacteria bacterium]
MLSPQSALIYIMTMVSAADRSMADAELRAIGAITERLPVFAGYDPERLLPAARQCSDMLKTSNYDAVLALAADAIPEALRETAYALACEVAAADGRLPVEESWFLGKVRNRLGLDRLIAAAIERGARARYRR